VQRNGALDDTGYTTFNQVCMEALMTGSVTGTDINTIKDMIWLSAHSSPDTANKFKSLLDSEDKYLRFLSAAILLWHRNEEGVPVMIECVRDKWDIVPEGGKTVPLWKAAIPFLGRTQSNDAVLLLTGLLQSCKDDLQTMILCIKSLGNIGGTAAVKPLMDILDESELSTGRVMLIRPTSQKYFKAPIENARWNIDLLVCGALLALGECSSKVKKVVNMYSNDYRAYVRRWAERLKQLYDIL
jgi:HEAT repeat protein